MPLSLSDYLGIGHEELDSLGCFDTILNLDSMTDRGGTASFGATPCRPDA